MRFLLPLLLLAFAGAAQGADARDAKGYWLGTEEGFTYKRALLLTHVEKFAPEEADGDGRFGSTGYADHRTEPRVVMWQARNKSGAVHVQVGEFLSLKLVGKDRMEGSIGASAGERKIAFERVSGEAQLKKVSFNAEALPAGKAVTVVFLSTPDCPACTWWIANHREAFVRGEVAKKLRYMEVKGANLKAGVLPADWPRELRAIAEQVGSARQPVPSFIVALDDRVVVRQFGALYWELRVVPLLDHLLGARAGKS